MATRAFPAISARTLPKWVMAFFVGGLGGIAPTLLRFGMDLSQKRMSVADISWSMLVGTAIFFVLGGAVAAIWDEVDLKKVFYIGLGLPSLITVVSSTASDPQKVAEFLPKASPAAFIGARFRPVSQNARLQIVLPEEIGYSGAVATFYGSGSPVRIPINANSAIEIPAQANEVVITAPNAESDRIPLRNILVGPGTVLRLAAHRDPLYGLKYAVGVHSKPYRLIPTSQTATGTADSPSQHSEVV